MFGCRGRVRGGLKLCWFVDICEGARLLRATSECHATTESFGIAEAEVFEDLELFVMCGKQDVCATVVVEVCDGWCGVHELLAVDGVADGCDAPFLEDIYTPGLCDDDEFFVGVCCDVCGDWGSCDCAIDF